MIGRGPAEGSTGPLACSLPGFTLLPVPTPLATAKAIARALRAARRFGETPEAVVLSPALRDQLQRATVGIFVWDSSETDLLFNVPVEVEPQATGWSIRVR